MYILPYSPPVGKGEIRTALQAAVALHEALGCNVFPIPRGSKTPTIRWRDLQKRKLMTIEIMGLFEPDPDANIAVICGKVSDHLIVLDCDAPKVLRRFGRIPDTPTCETSRGRHLYFRSDRPIRTTKLANGLDLRAEGSYVIAPPSVHPSGKRYQWIIPPFEVKPSPPPSWLLEMIQKTKINQISLPLPTIIKGVPEGWRNIESTRVIGKILHHFPISDWETWGWPLVKAWNALNRPPLDEKQLRATFNCIARKEAAKRRERDDALERLARVALEKTGSLRQLARETGLSRPKIQRILQRNS